MSPKKEISPEAKRVEDALRFQEFFKGDGGDSALEQIDKLTGYDKNGNLFTPDPYEHAFNAGMYKVSVLIHALLDTKIERKKE